MKWNQICVEFKGDGETIEIITNVFTELGAQGSQLEEQADAQNSNKKISTYLTLDQSATEFESVLLQRLSTLFNDGFFTARPVVRVQQVTDEPTGKSWQDFYQVTYLSRFLTIVPAWQDYQPEAGEIAIRLDPGESFGTGTHFTTRLAANCLELTAQPGMTVFDVGTGSGILSIIAWRLGATKIMAGELDVNALKFARHNLELNKATAAIDLVQGSLLAPFHGRANLIVANMLPVVLSPLIPQLKSHLEPGGQVIMTGIIGEQAQRIKTELQAVGFTINLTLSAGGWYCYRAQLVPEDN